MFRVWIQDSIETASDGIRMIRDGTIKITLAELSGTIAGIIIIVTIFHALVNPSEPTEKARTPREKRNKHKKGKKGRGGRNHHHNGNGGGGGSGHGKGRIRSGNYRPSKELYEPPSSRSSSPSGRARSESDMEGTTVSTFSDVGMVSPSPCMETTTSTATNNKQLEKSVPSDKNEPLGIDTTVTTPSILDQTDKKSSQKRQQQQSVGNKKSCGGGKDKKVPPKQPSTSQHHHQQQQPQMKRATSYPSETATVRVSGRRSQMSTNNGDKQKRVHVKKGKRSKQHQHQNSPANSEDIPKNKYNSNNFSSSLQAKSHYKARKNHFEDHHHHSRSNNSNIKARDFECDTTIGSNASYSHSECQNNYSSSSYFSASSQPATVRSTKSRQKEERQPAVFQNRRRSFTDPNSSVLQKSLNSSTLDQSLNVANDNISLASVPPQVPLMERMTHNDSFQAQSLQEANRDQTRVSDFSGVNDGLYDSNLASGLYHRHDVVSHPRSQVYSQFDYQHGALLGDSGCDGSPGLNTSIIRPPPGLVPSQQQNPVGHSSLIGRDLSESSHQGVPYLTSSSTSLYSNFSSNSVRNATLNAPQSSNDHFITSSSNNMDYSQRKVTLPSISPRNYTAPAPIGHERDVMH